MLRLPDPWVSRTMPSNMPPPLEGCSSGNTGAAVEWKLSGPGRAGGHARQRPGLEPGPWRGVLASGNGDHCLVVALADARGGVELAGALQRARGTRPLPGAADDAVNGGEVAGHRVQERLPASVDVALLRVDDPRRREQHDVSVAGGGGADRGDLEGAVQATLELACGAQADGRGAGARYRLLREGAADGLGVRLGEGQRGSGHTDDDDRG